MRLTKKDVLIFICRVLWRRDARKQDRTTCIVEQRSNSLTLETQNVNCVYAH